MWHVVALDDVAPSPWRNGGGETRVLVEWPDAQSWCWRISVAEVTSDGPFSRFDGVQRWLSILGGAGVRLHFDSNTVELTPHSAPLAFAGAESVHCQRLAGSVQDLNLMVRPESPDRVLHSQMLRVDGSYRVTAQHPRTVALYSAGAPALLLGPTGTLQLRARTLAWRELRARERVDVLATQAVCMEIYA